MRSRRGVVSSAYRDTRDWLTLAIEYGAIGAYLIDNNPLTDHIGTNKLVINDGFTSLPTFETGPRNRQAAIFNEGYNLRATGMEFEDPVISWSLEFWFRMPEDANGLMAGHFAPNFQNFAIDGVIDSGFGGLNISGTDDNNWHHFVRTVDGINEYVYMDGELIITRADSTGAKNGYGVLIGGYSDLWSFTGAISSVAVYDNHLASGQVRTLKAALGLGVGEWHLSVFPMDVRFGASVDGYDQYNSVDLNDLLSSEEGFDNVSVVDYVDVTLECIVDATSTEGHIQVATLNPDSESPFSEAGIWTTASSVPIVHNSGYANLGIESGDYPPSGPSFNVSDGSITVRYSPIGGLGWITTSGVLEASSQALALSGLLTKLPSYKITEIAVRWQ